MYSNYLHVKTPIYIRQVKHKAPSWLTFQVLSSEASHSSLLLAQLS
jgi:hypothetical protein